MSITQALSGTVELMVKGQEVYGHITKLMDEAEKLSHSGAAKKDIVLKLARDFIISLGKNWDNWAKFVIDFIDAAKSIYNAVRGLLK